VFFRRVLRQKYVSLIPRTRSCLRAILKTGFPIFVAIIQVLVGVFAYIYQAGKTLNLCCHGNPDKYEIWLKMTNFTAACCLWLWTPGKAHFLRSAHFLCCIKFALVLANITWNLTLLAPLKPMCTNRSKSPLKMIILARKDEVKGYMPHTV